METDDQQSVFYNRSGHEVHTRASEQTPPEPPGRNSANGRRPKRVQREESTASRRPLLDGDSVGSAGPEMRSNIYNPLMKEQSDVRQSGPYDHLAVKKTKSDELKDTEPESPHDYFTLESKANRGSETIVDIDSDTGYTGDPVPPIAETVNLENEIDKMDTILEDDDENTEPPKHDYFVLEPHEKEYSEEDMKRKQENGTTAKSSVKSNKSTKSNRSSSPVKEKQKPEAKPRVTKSGQNSPEKTATDPHDKELEDIEKLGKSGDKEKDEEYVLSKLGDAPTPPPGAKAELPTKETVPDEYLTPKEVHKAADYVDVLPYPPPRSSSLQPHEIETQKSPSRTGSNTSSSSSPAKSNSSVSTSPVKMSGSDKKPDSKNSSPTRISSSNQNSTTKTQGLPVKRPSSPAKIHSSPTKSTSTKSPLKKTSSSVTTDV